MFGMGRGMANKIKRETDKIYDEIKKEKEKKRLDSLRQRKTAPNHGMTLQEHEELLNRFKDI